MSKAYSIKEHIRELVSFDVISYGEHYKAIRASAVSLFLNALDMVYEDFEYENNIDPETYIFGNKVLDKSRFE